MKFSRFYKTIFTFYIRAILVEFQCDCWTIIYTGFVLSIVAEQEAEMDMPGSELYLDMSRWFGRIFV